MGKWLDWTFLGCTTDLSSTAFIHCRHINWCAKETCMLLVCVRSRWWWLALCWVLLPLPFSWGLSSRAFCASLCPATHYVVGGGDEGWEWMRSSESSPHRLPRRLTGPQPRDRQFCRRSKHSVSPWACYRICLPSCCWKIYLEFWFFF